MPAAPSSSATDLAARGRDRYFPASRHAAFSSPAAGPFAVESVRFNSTFAAPLGRRTLALVVALSLAASAGCQYTAQGKNAAGVQLYQSGQYQQAAHYFQQALYQDPQDADGYYNLASSYHQIGRVNRRQAELDQAEVLYNKCLDFNPNHNDCYRSLAVLLVDKNQPDKAQRLLENWYAANPTNSAAKVELARLREEFGDKNGAKEYLQQALTTNPYDIRALAALGRIQENEGNLTQALANYQRSLYRDQFQPEVAARVARLQTAVSGGQQTTPTGGTRTVTTPPAPLR
jgi:tetratricopeptide (TPR) repeat protein